MINRIIYLLLLSFLLGENKLPNDVRWVVNSSEYESLCYQTYSYATQQLDKYKDKENNKSLAIIMDLDETVLDNSQYQVELYEKNESYNPDSWAVWVLKEEAKLVPGAKEFIDIVRKKNIQLIFISNRMDARLEATINNMKKCKVSSDSDIYLLRLDKADKKTVRRNEVYTATGRMSKHNKFEVVLYLGDAMGDFPINDVNEFGKKQFIFPNPMYGKW